ncbi:hypothetical protein, conserved, partial [Trypanosoma cruzi]
MPLWTHFVNTKPEVDDNDLPLPKHRIYDDDGNLKPGETTPPRNSVSVTISKVKGLREKVNADDAK